MSWLDGDRFLSRQHGQPPRQPSDARHAKGWLCVIRRRRTRRRMGFTQGHFGLCSAICPLRRVCGGSRMRNVLRLGSNGSMPGAGRPGHVAVGPNAALSCRTEGGEAFSPTWKSRGPWRAGRYILEAALNSSVALHSGTTRRLRWESNGQGRGVLVSGTREV